MPLSGLKKGVNKGFSDGPSNGIMSGLQGGLTRGIQNGLAYHNFPIQDPVTLKGLKKPILYGLADYYTQPDGITTTLTDIANTGFTLTCNAGSTIRPAPVAKGIYGTKYYMDFTNTASYLTPNSSLSLAGYSEISVVMVVKLKSVNSKTLFHVDDSITPGGIDLNSINAATNAPQLQSIFYGGQAGTITSSIYNTVQSANIMFDWMIVTGKYRLSRPTGTGSEQEVHINGALSKVLSSSNFTVVTTTFSASKNIIIGNSSTSAGVNGAGIQLGSVAVFPYWLNSMEQLRLENYFRVYYGRKF